MHRFVHIFDVTHVKIVKNFNVLNALNDLNHKQNDKLAKNQKLFKFMYFVDLPHGFSFPIPQTLGLVNSSTFIMVLPFIDWLLFQPKTDDAKFIASISHKQKKFVLHHIVNFISEFHYHRKYKLEMDWTWLVRLRYETICIYLRCSCGFLCIFFHHGWDISFKYSLKFVGIYLSCLLWSTETWYLFFLLNFSVISSC